MIEKKNIHVIIGKLFNHFFSFFSFCAKSRGTISSSIIAANIFFIIFLFPSFPHVCVNLVWAASYWEKVFRRGDMINLLNSEYLICGTVDNSSRFSGEVLCSCDSNSLLAVDLR